MYLIQQVTSDPIQNRRLVLPWDGTTVELDIAYRPQQFGWFITLLSYKTFSLTNAKRICNSPNMLHQYLNQIPFGLACLSQGNREPTQQQDFSSGASQLYILTSDECREYSGFLSGGAA